MPFDANDPETKAALKEAVDTAVATATASTADAVEKLSANNKTLLAQLREAKKGSEIDPAKHAELEDRVAQLQDQLGTRDKDFKKLEKESQTTLATLQKQLESESGFTQTLLVENGLSEALVKAGVEPNFLPAVKAMLKGQVKIVAEGDARKALVGDKPLADFVTGWAQTDEGKHFVKAPANGGGGAGGGQGHGGNVKIIAADDKAAIGANLAELAKGVNGAVKIG
ncbi:hypothetical protein [Collimonas humicola]|uniref:hypothetical protein n=1 Tax=Collimonas humicola TaxID=2825886 RepID=UPI001B8AB4CF|nr:hypothetical protein [Collimonas humicola]